MSKALLETIKRFERPGASPEEIVAGMVLREFLPIVEERDRFQAALRDVMNLSRDHNDAIGIANNALSGEPRSMESPELYPKATAKMDATTPPCPDGGIYHER